MQNPADPPRNTLSVDQVVGLLQISPTITITPGLELIDTDLNAVEDISADLHGGSVSRSSFANMHGSAQLNLSRALDWSSDMVRPYLTMSDGVITARFNLGAYFVSTPREELETEPHEWAVEAYDILLGLADPVGEVYALAQGTSYLVAVAEILTERGFIDGLSFLIDQTAAASVLPSAKTWALDEQITWLTVVNDLLSAIGYAGIWSDWNGALRCTPYINPRDRGTEWVYDTGEFTAMLAPRRTIIRDFFETPNRWVAVRSNIVEGAAPAEGDGIFTYVNTATGLTSVGARGGRTITRILSIDAADQAGLVAAAQISIDADLRLTTIIEAVTFPNPLHWHFDKLLIADDSAGPYANVLGTKWTLPLSGEDMTHEWSVIS